jgi:hypothetical protein
MTWTEIKKWAKEKGYKADREKIKDSEKSYNYTWLKIDDESINGSATSVSKLATAIYNHISNNQWLQHQTDYKANLDTEVQPDGY